MGAARQFRDAIKGALPVMTRVRSQIGGSRLKRDMQMKEEWMTDSFCAKRWGVLAGIAGLAIVLATLPIGARAQVATTTVQGTVYRADGSTATGTVLVSWPAFSTGANQAVAAGNSTATIGQDGFVSLNLAPNLGAFPAGSY